MSTAALVAGRVAEAIQTHGQTQVAVAAATGIPRTTLRRRLSGRTPFTVDELAVVAAVLGVDVLEFFAESA